jgi:hypothetical protein
MRSSAKARLFAIASLAMLMAMLTARPSAAIEIRAVFLPLSGPDELGRSVGTILALQFWQTLVKEPPKGKKRELGDGSVYWIGRQVPIRSHADAARLAEAIDVTGQFTFWGHVHAFDQGALATSYLTLPDYQDFRAAKNEIWALGLPPGNEPSTISADVPRRHYAFEPVILPDDFVRHFSAPDALVMRSEKGSGRVLGQLGVRFDRIESDGDYAKVHSEGKIGWVYLPQLGTHKPEIVDFVGGIMRIYRTDWEGAIELFGNVIRNKETPTALRIDSYLYVIRAKSEIGQPADAEISAVLKLAPASKEAVQYAAMHYLARCVAATSSTCNPADREFLARLPERYGPLFDDDDAWLAQIRALGRKG